MKHLNFPLYDEWSWAGWQVQFFALKLWTLGISLDREHGVIAFPTMAIRKF